MNLQKIISLSWILARARFKLRNEGSYLGVMWHLLVPISLFGVIIFSKGAFYAQKAVDSYALYLLMGLIMYGFFNTVIGKSTTIIQSNRGVIKSIRFNSIVLIVAIIFESIFSHVFEVIIFIGLMLVLHHSVWTIVFYPIIFLFFCLFVFGLSCIFATIGAFIADLKNVWAVVSTVLLFGTPIWYGIYPGTTIYKVNLFNPLFYFLEAAHDVVIYARMPPLLILLGMIAWSFAAGSIGAFVFLKYKSRFPEII